MMISYQSGTNLFQYRAASILIHNGRILLQRTESNERWYIPGGRVEYNETAEQTVERELGEEFGVTSVSKQLVWIVENFVQFPDRNVHEIGMFFVVRLAEGHPLYEQEGDFDGTEEGFVNRWIPLEKLDGCTVVPEFVVPELRGLNMSAGIKSIISRSVR
ncbi:NUDIX hydrolase [Paenibacillus kobensis]|uniref:NUDIX hydrolase n=1 Tax=Paenibacillus kobensis TaxID=59841 RepID=UPI000FDABC5E|nr:NUDIX domain-containing protein [Paenibacillus kobensis]